MKHQTFFKFSMLFAFAMFVYSCDNGKKGTPNNMQPKHIIEIDRAVNMFKTERQIKQNVINPMLKQHYQDSTFEDTEFAWFPLEEMRQYIDYIDAIQKENPEQKVTGIRVYFGRNTSKNSKKYFNQQSVFFVPTVANKGMNSKYENLNHLPFAILPDNKENPIKGEYTILEDLVLNTNDKGARLKNFLDNSSKVQKASFSFNLVNFRFQEELTSTILNEGELAPPPKQDE